MDKKNFKIVVLGAGISGLATAYWLAKDGHDLKILEARGEPGGTYGLGSGSVDLSLQPTTSRRVNRNSTRVEARMVSLLGRGLATDYRRSVVGP